MKEADGFEKKTFNKWLDGMDQYRKNHPDDGDLRREIQDHIVGLGK